MKKKFLIVLAGITTLIFGSLMTSPASATNSLEGWYTWETTYTHPDNTPPTASTVTWPQTLIGKGKPAELTLKCGVWYQVDRYAGTNKAIKAVIKDGLLTRTNGVPEDHKIVKDWFFHYGGDCTTPEPEPETGELVEAVSLCTGPGEATITTTTTPWTQYPGEERVFGEPVVTVEVVADAGCVTDTPEPENPVKECPEGQVPGAPNDDDVFVCQNDNPTPEAPTPTPVVADPVFTG